MIRNREDPVTPDPIAAAARAAAARLAADHGPGLAADVEAALASRDTEQRPGQYLDPVSLGSLIVAIATLAWTIYTDKRKTTPNPPPSAVARQVRIELRQQGTTSPHDTDRITEIVVTELLQTAHDLADPPDQAR
jgi:hypothetical protein